MAGDHPGDGEWGLIFVSKVYPSNSKPVVNFALVNFGWGSSSSCSYCDRGKTKSTPCPTWTELLSLDKSLTI